MTDAAPSLAGGALAAAGGAAPLAVLIVDDSRLQRRILRALLAGQGCEVIEAESGGEALRICASRRIDLVISDWMMPGLDGLELCRRLRDRRGGAEDDETEGEDYVYFILLTTRSEAAQIAEGLHVGADDFLAKPVGRAELVARIAAGARLLAMQRALRESGRRARAALAELRARNAEAERDLRQARKLQQSLLRERHRDFGAASVSLALRSSGHVGGDLVGMFETGPGRVGVFGLDVSGHGVAAGLMAARLAGVLSGAAPSQNVALRRRPDGAREARAPREVAERLNALTLREMDETYFTLLYAEIDLASGRLGLVQAGHPAPLVLRADGRAEFPGLGGLPVGLIEGARYEDLAIGLAPGDRMLIFSDGMTECAGPDGAPLEEAGLARLAAGLRPLGGEAFLEGMMGALARFAGREDFADDVSAALIEYRGA